MKKILLFVIILLISISLVACGDSGASDEEKSNDQNSSLENSDQEKKDDGKDEKAAVGDVVKNEAGEMTLVSRKDDVGTFETGPIILTIEKANGVSGKLKGEMKELMETEEIEYIQVDMHVENTSDENIEFYASQAIMTTSTGEQLEPDMMMSDHIDGEFIGKVKKSGTSFYVLENSKAEDVESIRLIYSAPLNTDWEDVGEEIDIEIDLNK